MIENERFFAYDQVSIDASKIEEYEHDLFGPITVFKDVVIAREIVHNYKDGNAYKPASELKDAFWTAEGMWAISIGHPDTAVIMDRDQMHGRTVNPRYSKSLIDPKTKRPNNHGIVVDLEVFNNKVTPEVLEDMKNGKRHDISIGFFFNKDETPGIIEEDGHPLKGTSYDYVQRKMAINHTAFALEAGRCPMPFCGIGADEIAMHITGDPFGKWKTMTACIKEIMKENPKYTKEQAAATCATIEKKSKAKKDIVDMLNSWKASIDEVLSKFEDEELKKGEHPIVDDAMSVETPPKELLAFYTLSTKSWDTLFESERLELLRIWEFNKEYGKIITDSDESDDSDEVDVVDDCPDCEDDEEEIKRLATDLSLEDIDKKLKELKTARERLREQVRVLDEKLYQEPDAEKKRKAKIREERGELWDRLDDLYDEIRAYTQAKTLKITQSALVDEAEKKKEEESSEADPVDDVKKPFVATKTVEELLGRQP